MATQFAAQTITITPGTLAASATVGRQSAAVVTDVTLNVNDYRITYTVTPNGAPTGNKAVYVLVKTSSDAGTTWDGNASASDAAITIDVPNQFFLGCVLPLQTTAVARSASFSLKAACGGSLPERWGIIVINDSGVAFTSSAVTCRKEYNT